MLNIFWNWYKKNYSINLYITAGLFFLQLVHLYWLTVDVVFVHFFGYEFWNLGAVGKVIISLVDYTEIPAIILISIFYLHEFKLGSKWKSTLYLVLINSQWIHLFWITDEVILVQFTGSAVVALPLWLAWMAILIDYFELPVIYDTIKKTIFSLRK